MSKIKTIVVLLTFSLLMLSAKIVIAEPLKITPDLPLEKQVELWTLVYGGNVEINKKVIDCESQWNVNAIGDGGRSVGISQFQKASFERMAKALGVELDYYSSYDQIRLMVWAMNNGYAKEWSSFVAIQNGGTYSFYSKQLKKHFTVMCKL